jgi:predicted MPP superfamily phosphohydrolase
VRRIAIFLALLAGAAALLILYMYSVALRDPVVRRVSIGLADWPRGSAPIRIAFLSDSHVGGPDMPPERLSQIVAQVNALEPDLVLLGGDFVSDKRSSTKHYSGVDAIAPLGALRARFGAIGVFGNHDHWRGLPDIRTGLGAAHIRLLQNDAISIGPLSLGGTDDAFTGNDNVRATVDAMRRHVGARVLLSHSPDVVPRVPPDVSLILAGHTHCGQIRVPLIGAVSTMSKYGERFACGLSSDGPKRVITSAGLGTSILPLRLGAPPDLWLLTLGPEARS